MAGARNSNVVMSLSFRRVNEGNGGAGGGERKEGGEERKKEREALAVEIKSEKDRVTQTERWILKALFGYVETEPPLTNAEKIKNYKEAPIFVYETLWTRKDDDDTDRAFPLKNLLPTDGVPTLFPHSLSSIRDMFRQGRTMGPLQQTSFLRTVQHFSKLFASDMAVKSSGYVRLWISGAVGANTRDKRTKRNKIINMNRQTDTKTDRNRRNVEWTNK